MEEGRVIHHKAKPYFIPVDSPLEKHSAKVAPHMIEPQAQAQAHAHVRSYYAVIPFALSGTGAILNIVDKLLSDSPLEWRKLTSDFLWLAGSITGIIITLRRL
jgi:hypothetical protein